MKIRKTFLLISFLGFVSMLIAQNQLFILKDSSFVIGKVISKNDNEIVVKSNDKLITVLADQLIETYKITSKQNINELSNISFFNLTDIGMLAGKREGNEKYSFSFNMVNGAMYKDRISVGLGYGIEFMDINIIPLYADARYYINNGAVQFFAGMQGGFALPLEVAENDLNWNDFTYKKGLFYNPVIGFKANFTDSKNAFIITFGYRHMNIVGERWDDWWVDTKYEREFIYDRFSFRVGYFFN